MKKTLAILLALAMSAQISAFAAEEIVAAEDTAIEITEEVAAEETEVPEIPEKPERPEIEETEDAERPEPPAKPEGEEPDEEIEKPERRKFNKEDLFEKREKFRGKHIQPREYLDEIKVDFEDADEETRKLILEEIAAAKKELNDETIDVFAHGKNIDFDKYDGVKPRIENERTIVPVRAIAEALDAEVEWIAEENKVIITKGEYQVVLEIGNMTVLVNGEEQECEVAPKIEDGRTLVPVRIISEGMKKKVDWDNESQTIVIEDEAAEEVAETEVVEETVEEAVETEETVEETDAE